jgi:outer membrane protein assembly factor BamB
MRHRTYLAPLPLLIVLAAVLNPLIAKVGFGQDSVLPGLANLDAKRDWPFWRGPFRNGHSLAKNVPVQFDEKSNLKWKAPVPGRGHASPIVVGSKVFLSTSDPVAKTHSVLAFQLVDGTQLWAVKLNEGGFPVNNHAKNTEATPTIASDGQSLFVSYYHHDAVHLIALNMEGKKLWNERVDRFRPKMFEYGYAPSPIIYADTVIVAYEYDGPSAIVARSRKTGELVWKADRQSSISFSTPVVATMANCFGRRLDQRWQPAVQPSGTAIVYS